MPRLPGWLGPRRLGSSVHSRPPAAPRLPGAPPRQRSPPRWQPGRGLCDLVGFCLHRRSGSGRRSKSGRRPWFTAGDAGEPAAKRGGSRRRRDRCGGRSSCRELLQTATAAGAAGAAAAADGRRGLGDCGGSHGRRRHRYRNLARWRPRLAARHARQATAKLPRPRGGVRVERHRSDRGGHRRRDRCHRGTDADGASAPAVTMRAGASPAGGQGSPPSTRGRPRRIIRDKVAIITSSEPQGR